LNIKAFHTTDTGKVRTHNEDRMCVLSSSPVDQIDPLILFEEKKWILCAIADGMGGTNAGEVAAEIAIETVKNSSDKIKAILLRPTEIGKGLESLIYKAHLNIKNALNEENAGMGTTLILALINGKNVHLAWCGDSRAYKYSPAIMERKNKHDLTHLKILTQDHSLVWQMVRKGKLDPNEARTHELSNVITQSLGDPANDPKPESAIYTITPGDKILVCSDGLNSMLPDDFIQEILAHDHPVDELGHSLVEAANSAGGHDNITLILAQIESVPATMNSVIKSVKERPEAITAKSDVTERSMEKAIASSNLIMNQKTLIGILVVVAIAISYLYYSAKKMSEKENQEMLLSPSQTDTANTLPLNDTIWPKEGQKANEHTDTNQIIK
jgi:serine/threonine protein phosphatase PrpC